MLNQVQTNLSANSENGGPPTDNVVFTAISGFSFLSVQRFLGARSRAVASRDDGVGELWDDTASRESSELSNMLFLDSSQPCN